MLLETELNFFVLSSLPANKLSGLSVSNFCVMEMLSSKTETLLDAHKRMVRCTGGEFLLKSIRKIVPAKVNNPEQTTPSC